MTARTAAQALVISGLLVGTLDPAAATPYSCAELAVTDQQPVVPSAILGPLRALAIQPTIDIPWVARVQAEASRKLPELTLEGRIRVQHQLVVIGDRLRAAHNINPAWPGWAITLGVVSARIQALAPSRQQLAALGDPTRPIVSGFLGDQVIERATVTCGKGRSIHVAHFHGALAFRPLRTGDTRALVAQLVAFDDSGRPWTTPYVDHAEVRQWGLEGAPACVIEAGHDGALHPVEYRDLVEDRFVRRTSDGVGCNNCHRDTNALGARDVTAEELVDIDRARAAQVDQLATDLWQRISQLH